MLEARTNSTAARAQEKLHAYAFLPRSLLQQWFLGLYPVGFPPQLFRPQAATTLRLILQRLALSFMSGNLVMMLMGENAWDTPNVRRACKGAFPPQDIQKLEERRKRQVFDKAFYDLLKAFERHDNTLACVVKDNQWNYESCIFYSNLADERYQENKRLKTQIKSQQTRIRNLKAQLEQEKDVVKKAKKQLMKVKAQL